MVETSGNRDGSKGVILKTENICSLKLYTLQLSIAPEQLNQIHYSASARTCTADE